MRVKYLCSEASETWSRVPGEIYDLPDAEAKGAIAAGKAEAISEEKPAAENATRSAPENASMPRSRGKNA